MGKHNVTSGDVARLAQVSQSAVSRTFTPGASVSDETRRKVLDAAHQLGYRPNALARAMISGRSRLVALVVADLNNHFYPLVLERLARAVQARGYHILMIMTDAGEQDDIVQQMLEYQVEGIVMASNTLSSNLAAECASTGIPVVLFNRYVLASVASSVMSDNAEGGRMIGRLLAQAGHERIAFIAGSEDSSTNRDRELGFRRGLAEFGMAIFARGVGHYAAEQAARAAREMFSQATRPDAVFVANDHMAFTVMDVLRDEFELDIPLDVSVAGYDNVPESDWTGYRLTTVEQPCDAMVQATVDTLMAQIERGAVQHTATVLPARLVIRASTRPVAANSET